MLTISIICMCGCAQKRYFGFVVVAFVVTIWLCVVTCCSDFKCSNALLPSSHSNPLHLLVNVSSSPKWPELQNVCAWNGNNLRSFFEFANEAYATNTVIRFIALSPFIPIDVYDIVVDVRAVWCFVCGSSIDSNMNFKPKTSDRGKGKEKSISFVLVYLALLYLYVRLFLFLFLSPVYVGFIFFFWARIEIRLLCVVLVFIFV